MGPKSANGMVGRAGNHSRLSNSQPDDVKENDTPSGFSSFPTSAIPEPSDSKLVFDHDATAQLPPWRRLTR